MSGLIERGEALAALERLARESAAGQSLLAVVDGPAGCGKSALMRGFLESAANDGAVTLAATAPREERALPFDVLTQLLATARVPAPFRRQVQEHLDTVTTSSSVAGAGPNGALVDVADLQRLYVLLLRIADTAPLVLAVDDVHDSDTPSLLCLSYVVRRLGSTPVLVLLTEDGTARPAGSELLAQPDLRRIKLGPLTEEGSTRLLACRLDGAARGRIAELTRIGGGNPLLIEALAADQRSGADRHAPEYSRALLHCLRRSGPIAVDVASALAALGAGASAEAVGRLAGADSRRTDQTLRALEQAGILDAGAFRHPGAATLVLDDMPTAARSELHQRAAELLHDEGAPALPIAEQLVRAGKVRTAWAAPLLLEASREALLVDRAHDALDYLQLAERPDPDAATRAAIRSQRGRLEWQLRPATAHRELAAPVDAMAADDLADLAWRLSWYGRVDDVTSVVDALRGPRRRGHDAAEGEARAVAAWLACAYPRYAGGLKDGRRAAGTGTAVAPRGDPWLASASTLADLVVRGRADEASGYADRVLQSLRLDHGSLWSGECGLLALLSLVYAERPDAAAAWCDRLTVEADARDAPTWRAVFIAVGAEIALRGGDLPDAYRRAERALALVPSQGWGVTLGLPLSCAMLAAVRMGKPDLARRHATQAFPESMLESRYGVHYLNARGHYHLATGHAQAALADFMSCGELIDGWSACGAGLVPWRARAAEAWLRLGNRDQASRLVRDQLAKLPSGDTRARGLTLRVLAAASAVDRRPRLLADAVDVLSDRGDRYELACALTDLAAALRQVGDLKNARRTARRAWHLARSCGAEPLYREALPEGRRTTATQPRDGQRLRSLTAQQRRVASLASEGYTNHEIAAKLSITASTVEQHLTRIFRKLDVKQRQELAHYLGA
jgi:DNA-binding CsgD family transcriptional regulator